jgi:hypothetical protein
MDWHINFSFSLIRLYSENIYRFGVYTQISYAIDAFELNVLCTRISLTNNIIINTPTNISRMYITDLSQFKHRQDREREEANALARFELGKWKERENLFRT